MTGKMSFFGEDGQQMSDTDNVFIRSGAMVESFTLKRQDGAEITIDRDANLEVISVRIIGGDYKDATAIYGLLSRMACNAAMNSGESTTGPLAL